MGEKFELLVSQGGEAVPEFTLQARAAAGTPALERIGREDLPGSRFPITGPETALRHNPCQLRTERGGRKTQGVALDRG